MAHFFIFTISALLMIFSFFTDTDWSSPHRENKKGSHDFLHSVHQFFPVNLNFN